jgi:hypothetical protein
MSRFVIGQSDGDIVALPMGGVGVQFKIDGEWTRGAVSIVEHPIQPGGFAVPHTHTNEDEISYVLEGTLGAEPRGLKHAFWNPAREPARIIEIIAPAGLERLFRTASTSRLQGTEDFNRGLANMAEHGVRPHFDELEAFIARHGLQMPAMPMPAG